MHFFGRVLSPHLHTVDLFVCQLVNIAPLGEVSADQVIGVFIEFAFSRVIGMREVGLCIQRFGELSVHRGPMLLTLDGCMPIVSAIDLWV